MLLKRLELHGLKSFADKTVLDLSRDITAIVGPNGSGKSNITDGIRWLLGERDARNLRGAKGEDLIFAGTEKRPRMGMAQATLYFDNSSGFFPVDFKEVSISRRISRDGVSQFYINKSEVRLKDLIDLLARAKMGSRSPAIINQGESDVFITSTPQERREMIEEILGLKEYQLKKADALRKLKNTKFNLEKAKALVEELKPHLRLLRKQSSRYENRERIAEELINTENVFYGSRLKKFKDDSEEIKNIEKEIDRKIKQIEPSFHKVEKELQGVNKSEPEAIEELRKMQSNKQIFFEKRAELQKELGKIEAQLEFNKEEKVNRGVDVQGVLKEIRKIASDLYNESDIWKLRIGIKRVLEIVNNIFDKPQGEEHEDLKQRQHTELLERIQKLDKEILSLSNKEKEHQQTLESFNKRFRDVYGRVEVERKKLDTLFSEKNKIGLARERINLQIHNLKEELSQIGRSITSLEEAAASVGIDNNHVIEEESAVMRRMFHMRQELASIGEVDESVIKDARETENRHEFLIKQISDMEHATKDLKSLIKELDIKIYTEFNNAIKSINEEFQRLVKEMFGGGKGKLIVRKIDQVSDEKIASDGEQLKGDDIGKENGAEEIEETKEDMAEDEGTNQTDLLGVDIDITLPRKKIRGLDVLSGGERSLVSIAALFALISISPPPFLLLDEIDAALDEKNARRYGDILKEFSGKTQFILVTHNRATMSVANVLYGCTMSSDGTSRLISLKLA
jgi:chromosome segregation protein